MSFTNKTLAFLAELEKASSAEILAAEDVLDNVMCGRMDLSTTRQLMAHRLSMMLMRIRRGYEKE